MMAHIHRKVAALSVAFILLTVSVSCQYEGGDPDLEVPPDSTLTKTVTTRLNQAEHMAVDSLEIGVREGVVMLKGSVDNLLTKNRATNIVTNVYGVISVVNNLDVETNRSDSLISRDVSRVLNNDPSTEDWELHADVQGGHVRLIGSVDSWQEKRLARKLAASVKGVTGITNDIVVGYNETRKPERIKSEVRRTLQLDSRINSQNINIQVDQYTVVLSGEVGSLEEKQLAKQIAHVSGVKKVITRDLNVRPTITSKMTEQDIPGEISDLLKKRAIKRALHYDPRVDTSQINVTVSDGVATLSGTVNHLISKRNAGQNALNTVGIHTVKNNINVVHKLVVRPAVPTTDQGIKERIEAMINRDPYVELVEVDITVNDGNVVLDGNVTSEFEKTYIEQLSERVKGVISIDNRISVESGKSM